jgi:hypothetical protein
MSDEVKTTDLEIQDSFVAVDDTVLPEGNAVIPEVEQPNFMEVRNFPVGLGILKNEVIMHFPDKISGLIMTPMEARNVSKQLRELANKLIEKGVKK